jgi:hypothetical protein
MKIIQTGKPAIDSKSRNKLLENYQEEGITIVHCSYVSSQKYVNGGWVNIYPTTYLVNSAESELGLLHAENIPLAPERHMFSRCGELKSFTLYFPLLPKSWERFDFVERTRTSNGFVVRDIRRNQMGVYEIRLC